MKNHYRGHKMAVWLNLIPQLHQPGEDVSMTHHHFRENSDPFYAGMYAVELARETPLSDLEFWSRCRSRRVVHASDSKSTEHFGLHDDVLRHGRRRRVAVRWHAEHQRDPRRHQGRRRHASASGVAPLLQHHHGPGDNGGDRLLPPGAQHAHLRGDLLPERSGKEASRCSCVLWCWDHAAPRLEQRS